MRERLSRLTIENLLEIAARLGIHLENPGREELISTIQEIMEEDRQERESSNNPAMSIKNKKYDILQDDELESQIDQDYPLPESYNENRIVLLLRDPHWAFTYWDIKPADLMEFSVNPDFEELFLRVSHSTGVDSRDNVFFDIPVHTADQSWYINLPIQGVKYRLKLISRINGKENVVCESNEIYGPVGDVAGIPQPEPDQEMIDMLLMLSGLSEFSDSEYIKKIPQRIISLSESRYLSIVD